jgi:hypothetical protein
MQVRINVRMPNKMVRLLFSNAPYKSGDRTDQYILLNSLISASVILACLTCSLL